MTRFELKLNIVCRCRHPQYCRDIESSAGEGVPQGGGLVREGSHTARGTWDTANISLSVTSEPSHKKSA